MNKKIFKWVVILLVTFVLGWLLLKAVSVKETKVITSKNTYDILNNPHVSKVSDYISALMNHNHEKEKLFYEKLDSYSKDSTSSISYQSFKSKNGMLSLLPTYTRTKTGSDEIVDEMGLIGNIELGKCIVLVDDTLDNQRTALIFPKDSASRDDQGRLIFMNKTWEEGEELSVGVLPNEYKSSDKNYKEIDVKEICDSQNFFFVVA